MSHRALVSLAVAATLAAAPTFAQMTLRAPGIPAGGPFATAQVLNGFGCKGGNVSPALDWSGAPAGTKSFVVTLFDKDAPTGSGWWHWTVYDIPANSGGLPEGAGSAGAGLPEGAEQGRNDFGATGYGGACPPPGDAPHHYVLTVYALKLANLPLDPGAPGAMVSYMARGNSLGSASLTVLYGR